MSKTPPNILPPPLPTAADGDSEVRISFAEPPPPDTILSAPLPTPQSLQVDRQAQLRTGADLDVPICHNAEGTLLQEPISPV